MYEFVNLNRIDINTGNETKTELDKLIQDAGLGYTDLLLDNLDRLSKYGIDSARELLDYLVKLRDKECELRLDIENPQQLDKEIKLNYWFDFQLYGYASICNCILYNNEIVLTDNKEALNLLFNAYKNDPQLIINKLNSLIKNSNLKYISKLTYDKKVEKDKIKEKNKEKNKESFKMSDLDSILIF